VKHGASPPDRTATFSTDTSGLPDAAAPRLVELEGGATFDLRIGPVAKTLGDDRVRMLSYNGSVPGPTLRVPQGSEITVRVHNDGDTEATVHWHGLRLANEYDGVPYETQAPIPIGGGFTYRLQFPDPGLYWYHPHVREDYGLEMGLYGNIVVVPSDPDYWPPVHREAVVTLDDVLIEDGRIAPFHEAGPTHVAMGRFGNVMLTGGTTDLELVAQQGEVVRFGFTNTANTRLFNIAFPGARMKLVGGDSGRYEHEVYVDEILLSPSERAIVDVLFDTPGTVPLEHRTPDHTYVLGAVNVSEVAITPSLADAFAELRTDEELAAVRARIDADVARAPDKTLAFTSEMPLLYGEPHGDVTSYVCPMHPDVTATEAGTCPHCGMRLVPATGEPAGGHGAHAEEHAAHEHDAHPHAHGHEHDPQAPAEHAHAAHGAHEHDAHLHDAGHEHAHEHDHPAADGLEWEDLMPAINVASDAHNMSWKLVDVETGHENWTIDWAFRVGDQVKIRLVNGMDQDHPMHHPFHIHGAGRFLVLSRDGVVEPNLVWKDTVLVRAGETVDIVLDVTNPGLWMAHCHIAEHNQSGMMFSFPVADSR
jgi:FtsP/CotA-like multicopper oxidase with cupredoxin domain